MFDPKRIQLGVCQSVHEAILWRLGDHDQLIWDPASVPPTDGRILVKTLITASSAANTIYWQISLD
jgi:hypothetical protein